MFSAVTLDQLRALIAVAEEGGFSAAGRRLGRVQSAISQSIQALEAGLEVQLFDRAAKTPVLTEQGRVLLDQARQVVLEAAALGAQAKAMTKGMEPELSLAIDNLFPSAPLLFSLQALRGQFPDLSVTLITAPIFGAERRLREGGAHIALCSFRPGQDAALVAQPLTTIDMVPVAAPDHPLAHHGGPIPREVLARHVQLILTDPAAPPEAPSFGVIGAKVWRFVDLGRRLDFLRAGFGWGAMPRHMVGDLIAAGDLAELALVEPSLLPRRVPIQAVHARERPPGPAGRWFLDHLQAACGEAMV